MGKLNFSEKQLIEKVFQMKSGYVLDFTHRSFQEFMKDVLNVDIFHEYPNLSKAKMLRRIIEEYPDTYIGKVILSLINYMEENNLINIQNKEDVIKLKNLGLVKLGKQTPSSNKASIINTPDKNCTTTYNCLASDFKIWDGIISYNPIHNMCLRDSRIRAINDNFLSNISQKFDIQIVGNGYFEFVGGEKTLEFFLKVLNKAKATKIASAYCQLLLKKVDTYFQENYALSIPKNDIIYKENQIVAKTRNCKFVFFADQNVQLLTSDLYIKEKEYNEDFSSYISTVEKTIENLCVQKELKVKEKKELIIYTNLSANNLSFLLKIEEGKNIILVPDNNNSYNIVLENTLPAGYNSESWRYKIIKNHRAIIFEGKYYGKSLYGEIVSFSEDTVNRCLHLMKNKFMKGRKNIYDQTCYLHQKKYVPFFQIDYTKNYDKRLEKAFDNYNSNDWNFYFLEEDHTYYSDDPLWTKTLPISWLYFIVSKEPKYNKRYKIILHTKVKNHADYILFVENNKLDLALCFLSDYFISELPNKREHFSNFSYDILKSVGISYWYKE